MATVVMVRTVCCESYKCGNRCSICPNRPENQAAAQQFQQTAQTISFGRRINVLPASVALAQAEHRVAE